MASGEVVAPRSRRGRSVAAPRERSTPLQAIVVEPDADVHTLAVESNRDEDTYAPLDLFDHLDRIVTLREEHTQAEIGEKIGWDRGKVANHMRLLENIVTDILEVARRHQEGRVTEDATSVTNFTEGWFRTSGLYDLSVDSQAEFIEWSVAEKRCSTTKNTVTNKTEQLATVEA